MKAIFAWLLVGVSMIVMSGCGGRGLRAGSSGGATLGGTGGISVGGAVEVDAAAAGGAGGIPGGPTAGTSANGGDGGVGGIVNGGSRSGGNASLSGGRTGSTGGMGGSSRVGGSPSGGSASGGRTGATAGANGGTGGSAGVASSSGGRTGGTAGAGSGGGSGILASGYCTGSTAKVTYQGQDATPFATNYQSAIILDCCNAVGVNLHTKASLGLDLQVEVIMGGTPTTGEYTLPTSSSPYLRAAIRTEQEPVQPEHSGSGSLRFAGNPYGTQAWELGICLQLDDTTSPSVGTRIYVPSVIMAPYSWQKRFQLYLLQDTSLTAYAAGQLPLDSLTLATTPLLDLGSIAYVEQATGRIGLNPGQKIGTSLRSRLGQVDMYGLAFVVVADDVRIYLGSFMSPISSVSPTGPWVELDNVGTILEGITENGFVIQPPRSTSPDPRQDPRIIKVLTETGKLVP
jgi:hypothetical protein